MRFSPTAISSVASYTKMSETLVTPTSPSKEVTTPTINNNNNNNTNGKKFEGDGVIFKGKLIGVEELSIDRDEKICLDSMFKLKAVARARGEHKQRIHLQLTMTAVRIMDDVTKAQVVSHEIERISFVVIDPRDNRAFGYIYNTPDDHHQFWAIKTERTAAGTVLALKELFELAFEQFTNAEKFKLQTNKTTTTTTSESPTNPTVSTQESSSTMPNTSLPPAPTPVVATPSLLDDDIWSNNTPTTTITQTTSPPVSDLWDINAPPEPVKPPAPKIVDPLAELFDGLTTTTQPVAPTNTTSPLLGLSPNTTVPLSTNPYANSSSSTTNGNLVNATPTLPQQQQPIIPRIAPPPPQIQQPNLLASRPLSPVAPPTVTNPFSGFNFLEDLTSATTTKTGKDLFFPPGPPPKTIQQLQMEKQS